MRIRIFVTAVVVSLYALGALPVAAQTYTVTKIGTLGGTWSSPEAVNDAGQVVGYSATAGNVATHAFLRTPTEGMIDLGTLGGRDSYAYGINNAGQVVDSHESL